MPNIPDFERYSAAMDAALAEAEAEVEERVTESREYGIRYSTGLTVVYPAEEARLIRCCSDDVLVSRRVWHGPWEEA